jgi:cobaltochelatase CobS
MKKQWFITRDKNFVECNIEKETPKKRFIKVVEKGHKLSGKKLVIPPKNVARGNLFPRIFESDAKPSKFFEYNGRIVLDRSAELVDESGNPDTNKKMMVPDMDSYYFQPVTKKIVDCIIQNDKVLLTGEAGTGKTTHIEQIAARTGQTVRRINMNVETRISEFLGKIHVAEGKTFWVYGVLPLAMMNGDWIIMDELDMAEPNILSVLHPVLEPNGKLVLKENNGEVIAPHPNFRLFATANSIGSMQTKSDAYSGTNQMNSALLDRFHILRMPNMEEKMEVRVIKSKVPALKSKWVKSIVQFANHVRHQDEDNKQINIDNFSTRRCLQWAEKMALYGNPIEAAEGVFLEKISSEDREVAINMIKTMFHFKGKQRKSADASKQADAPAVPKKRGRPKKMLVM